MVKVKNFIIRNLRRFKFFNRYENEEMSKEFKAVIKGIKERNSQILFENYYKPKAVTAILREDNYLASEDLINDRAFAMFMQDIAQGALNEFYRFT